tara:strand:+ start:167 stop:739 length:573 start_codon:yes stop_codon:yes gene_type:complete
MEYSQLSKEEKQNIFEIVNTTHLHTKGNKKKLLKSQFCNSWKINKNIGAFELFMKLYESEDVYDKYNEWFKKYIDTHPGQPTPESIRSEKNIPYSKYVRNLGYKNEELEELEQKLEDVESGKGYMTEAKHDELLQLNTSKLYETIREQGDTIAKLRNEITDKDIIIAAKKATIQERTEWYESQLKIAYQK